MRKHTKRVGKTAQSGYALVLVMFFLALLVLTMAAAAPTVLSGIQRERESEMVWRGKQYARGIRLYYMKMNRFPTSLDDLTKPKTGIRFMRQAYKDPMNEVDGSWRLIFIGPNGQLIGSANDHSVTSSVGGAQTTESSLFSSGNGPGLTSATSHSSDFSGFAASQGQGNIQTTPMLAASANGTASKNALGSDSTDDPNQPQSLAGPMDASNTIGGNIIGVGSKVDKKSFMVYLTAKNYKHFEFIASMSRTASIQNINVANPAGTATPNSPFPAGVSGPNVQNVNQTQVPAQTLSQDASPSLDPNQMPALSPPPNQ